MMTHTYSPAACPQFQRSLRSVWLALGLLLALAFPALTRPAVAQADEVLQIRAIPQRTPVHPGDQFAVAIIMEFSNGWHAWPNKPVPPPELGDDFDAIPTVIRPIAAAPAGWIFHTDFAQWPTPHAVSTAGLTGSPVEILSYSDRAVVFLPVTVPPDAVPGELSLTIELHYQACNDSLCQQPTTATTDLKLTVAPLGATPPKENDPSTFKDFDGAIFAKIAGAGPSTPADANTPPSRPGSTPDSTPPASADVRPNLFGYDLPAATSFLGVLVLFLASALGGAILNLTPCVLPVIPIKVMTLSQHAGGSLRKTLILGFWMALGVTVFWMALGVPMALLGAAADPSRYIFGTWWVTLSLGVIIVAAALGIMGLFTFNLPQSLYMINPRADSPWGSFVFGIMTAIFGLPCFGLVAGGLLAIVSTVPGIVTMVIFTGIGVGMAIPYLVLAAFPKLLEKIPRTGPASELVKQVMGLLLLAAAAFFISGGIEGLLTAKPYLKETIAWWAVAFFVLVAGVWLTVRVLQISKKAWARISMPIVALLGVILFAGIADAMSETARADYIRRTAAGASTTQLVSGTWNHWEPAHVQLAKDSGKIVIADFTARWCINCKLWKAKFLDTDPVRSELLRDDIIMLKVDLSDTDGPGWKWLRELGRTAVPTLIVFEPGLSNPTIMNAYTSDTVLAALKHARTKSASLGSPSTPDANSPQADKPVQTGVWIDWNDAQWANATQLGKPIVIDFTARWDTNCKVLRRTVLDVEPVKSALNDYIKFEVDMTDADAPGWQFIKRFGRTQVPTLVVIHPGRPDPIIMNSHTSDSVMESLRNANQAVEPELGT